LGLSDEDVREILRIIDESQLDELRIDMDGFQLHVRRGGAPPATAVQVPPPRDGAPGEASFVEVGSQVDADTVVGLIEVMKMMNSVKAGLAGTVVEVCAANAAAGAWLPHLIRHQTEQDRVTAAALEGHVRAKDGLTRGPQRSATR
jgi:hypothetical protein